MLKNKATKLIVTLALSVTMLFAVVATSQAWTYAPCSWGGKGHKITCGGRSTKGAVYLSQGAGASIYVYASGAWRYVICTRSLNGACRYG